MPLCANGFLWHPSSPFSSQTKPALVHLLDQWAKVAGRLHVSTLGPAGILEIGFHCHCSLLPSQALCTLEWKAEVCSINLYRSKKFPLIPQRLAEKWPVIFHHAVLKGCFQLNHPFYLILQTFELRSFSLFIHFHLCK